MKVWIFGIDGMAGHMIRDWLLQRSGFLVAGSSRRAERKPEMYRVDVRDDASCRCLLEEFAPDVVVNAVGVLGKAAERDPLEAISVNSRFPHLLASWGEELGFRLIHVSTDCVFSGKQGGYREGDVPDGTGWYARTKALGEVDRPPHLTIRTSIIGPELKEDGIGLFHWFMRQRGQVDGWREAFWSGVTTLELAKAVEWFIRHPGVCGVVHLTSRRKISKLELLEKIRTIFGKTDVSIRPVSGVQTDKSLVNTREDVPYPVPGYGRMLEELREWMIRSDRRYPY